MSRQMLFDKIECFWTRCNDPIGFFEAKWPMIKAISELRWLLIRLRAEKNFIFVDLLPVLEQKGTIILRLNNIEYCASFKHSFLSTIVRFVI